MWFWFSLTAWVLWSGSDIFSKVGSRPDDKLSHWKMVMAVGLVMGLHALYETVIGGVVLSLSDILTYLPASALYISSMLLGYIGLRYIELGISSPLCNSSGAVAAVLCFLFLQEPPAPLMWIAIGLVAVGMVSLGVIESTEDDEMRSLRQEQSQYKYSRSILGLLLPILYCLLDALGTFADSVILREDPTGTILDRIFPTVLDESVANVAYELTFLAVGIGAAVYVLLIRREKLTLTREAPKLLGGVLETAGQFAYIYALGDTAHAGFAAAIIASYCALSAIWSRIFLKEKLSWKHICALTFIFAGIIILGVFDA